MSYKRFRFCCAGEPFDPQSPQRENILCLPPDSPDVSLMVLLNGEDSGVMSGSSAASDTGDTT